MKKKMDVFEKSFKKIEHDKKYLESYCQCANIGPTGPIGPLDLAVPLH